MLVKASSLSVLVRERPPRSYRDRHSVCHSCCEIGGYFGNVKVEMRRVGSSLPQDRLASERVSRRVGRRCVADHLTQAASIRIDCEPAVVVDAQLRPTLEQDEPVLRWPTQAIATVSQQRRHRQHTSLLTVVTVGVPVKISVLPFGENATFCALVEPPVGVISFPSVRA